MGLQLNANDARQGDTVSNVIRESGEYVATITRAEKLFSRNEVEGVGLSIRTDDGATANYLDLYTIKPDGTKLRGYHLVQALLCCTKVKNADEGAIKFEKWDSNERRIMEAQATGYPALMGKRIGVFLQQELQTHSTTGENVERLNLIGVFEAATGLTATEILDGKTKPERAEKYRQILAKTPIRDVRKGADKQEARPKPANGNHQAAAKTQHEFDDDIPF
jgi:hypothetical protein